MHPPFCRDQLSRRTIRPHGLHIARTSCPSTGRPLAWADQATITSAHEGVGGIPYRPSGWTVARAARNLEAKLPTRDFTSDIEQLVANWPEGYSIQGAAQVANTVLNSIDAIDNGR